MKGKYLIISLAIIFTITGYFCASASNSGQATTDLANQLEQNFVTKILNEGALVEYDTYLTVTPTATYQYYDNTDAFLQQMTSLNITKVYVTGSARNGFNFNGYTDDWSAGVHCYTPRPLVWKWLGL